MRSLVFLRNGQFPSLSIICFFTSFSLHILSSLNPMMDVSSSFLLASYLAAVMNFVMSACIYSTLARSRPEITAGGRNTPIDGIRKSDSSILPSLLALLDFRSMPQRSWFRYQILGAADCVKVSVQQCPSI